MAGHSGSRRQPVSLGHYKKTSFRERCSSDASNAAARGAYPSSLLRASAATAHKDLRCPPAAGCGALSVPCKGVGRDTKAEDPPDLISILLQVHETLASSRCIKSSPPEEVDHAWLTALALAFRVQHAGEAPIRVAAGGAQHHSGAASSTLRAAGSSPSRKGIGDRKGNLQQEGARKRGEGGGGHGRANVPELKDRKRQFACPFFKYNPLKYWKCLTYQLRHPTDVRQHIERNHVLHNHSQCPTCGALFEDDAGEHQRNAHIAQQPPCQSQDFPLDGATEAQWNEIKQDATRKERRSNEDRWYTIWDILLPKGNPPRPRSVECQGVVEILDTIRLQVNNQTPGTVTDILLADSSVAVGLAPAQLHSIVLAVFQTLVNSQLPQEMPHPEPLQAGGPGLGQRPQGRTPANLVGALGGNYTAGFAAVLAGPSTDESMPYPPPQPDMLGDQHSSVWSPSYSDALNYTFEASASGAHLPSALIPNQSWSNESDTCMGSYAVSPGPNVVGDSWRTNQMLYDVSMAPNLEEEMTQDHCGS